MLRDKVAKSSSLLFCMALALSLSLTSFSCHSSKLDARAVAEALADEFGDWLDFDNGTVEPGEPPQEHPDDPAYPQVSSLNAPAELSPSQPFSVTLTSTDGFAGNVIGAAVHVHQANKADVAQRHIIITQAPAVPGQLILTGQTLAALQNGVGNAFIVRFALLTDDVGATIEAGNYIAWNLVVPAPQETLTVVPQCEATYESFSMSHTSEPGMEEHSPWSMSVSNLRAIGNIQPVLALLQIEYDQYDMSDYEVHADSLWYDFVTGANTSFATPVMFPSGTRFPGYFMGLSYDDCALEITCEGNVPFGL